MFLLALLLGPLFGCTDSLALNYDPTADTDDGSCILACTAVSTCESFDAGFPGSWTNNGWILNSGTTPSFNTGPSDDVTGGGLYMFYETWSTSITNFNTNRVL